MKNNKTIKFLFLFMLLTNMVMGFGLINVMQQHEQYQDTIRSLENEMGYRDARIHSLDRDILELERRLNKIVIETNK